MSNTLSKQRNLRRMSGLAVAFASVSIAFGQFTYPSTFSRQDIVRGGTPTTSYGAFIVGETQGTTSTTAPTQSADHTVIAPFRLGLSETLSEFYGAGHSSGFTSSASQNDSIISFVFQQDTSTPTLLTVTNRNVPVRTNPGTTNPIRALGLGSIDAFGIIAFRFDSGTGGTPDSLRRNGIGTVSGLSTITSVLTDYNFGSVAGSFFSLAIREGTPTGAPTATVPLQVPSIGSADGMILSSSFNRELLGIREDLDPSFEYAPYGQVFSSFLPPTPGSGLSGQDNRGAITYNDVAAKAVIYNYVKNPEPNPTTSTSGYVNGVRVYNVNSPENGFLNMTDLNGNLSNTGTLIPFPTIDGVATRGSNYFSRSAFAGTPQVAMNDKGDIAVVVSITDGTTDEETQEGIEKAYLFARFNGVGYDAWQVVARSNGSVGDFIGQGTAPRPVGVGCPALDNNGNVYFTAPYQIANNSSGTPTFADNAVFRAAANDPDVPTAWTVDAIIREGDEIGTGNTREFVDSIIVQGSGSLTAGTVRVNTPSALGPFSVSRDGLGTVFVNIRTRLGGSSSTNALRNRYVVLQPK